MRKAYLIYSFTAFIAWLILDKMGYQFKWIAMGFGVVMFLLGVFMKNKVKATSPSGSSEEEITNNLNKKESVIEE